MKNRAFALIIVLTAIASLIYYFESQKVSVPSEVDILDENSIESDIPAENSESSGSNQAQVQERISDYIPDEKAIASKSANFQQAPELRGIAGYINTDDSISIANQKGKVVLVDFWTYTCINCIRTLPYIKEWHDKYKDKGLVIIGVHTPEFEFEKDYNNVKQAAEKYRLQYPIVQDNSYSTWRAYNNRFWPRKYLIDIDGFVRYDHIGEGAYAETEMKIQELLQERAERMGMEQDISMEISRPEDAVSITGNIGTPELYLGYDFTRGNFGNEEGLPANRIVDYTLPEKMLDNYIYLEGKWKVNADNIESEEEGARLILNYDAKVLNIVAGSDSEAEIEVFIDGKKADESTKGGDIGTSGIAKVNEERLYNLADYEYGKHRIEIVAKGKRFKLYTFTFG